MWLIYIQFITVFVDKVSALVYCSFPKYYSYYSNSSGYQQSVYYYITSCDYYCRYSECGNSSSNAVVRTTYTGPIVGAVVGSVVVLGILIGVAIYCGRSRPGNPGRVLNLGITGHSTVPYMPTPDMQCPAEPNVDTTATDSGE